MKGLLMAEEESLSVRAFDAKQTSTPKSLARYVNGSE